MSLDNYELFSYGCSCISNVHLLVYFVSSFLAVVIYFIESLFRIDFFRSYYLCSKAVFHVALLRIVFSFVCYMIVPTY